MKDRWGMLWVCWLPSLIVGCSTPVNFLGSPTIYGVRTQVVDSGRSSFVKELSAINTVEATFWERMVELGASPKEIAVSKQDLFVGEPYSYVTLFTDAEIADVVTRARCFLPEGAWRVIRRTLPFESTISPGAYATVYGNKSVRVCIHVFTPHGWGPDEVPRCAIVVKAIGLRKGQLESALDEMGILAPTGRKNSLADSDCPVQIPIVDFSN